MKNPSFHSKLSRRHFLGLAGAAVAFPTIIPSSALGRGDTPAPSNRIALGVIGCGNQGGNDTKAFLAEKQCQVIATCDVDKNISPIPPPSSTSITATRIARCTTISAS